MAAITAIFDFDELVVCIHDCFDSGMMISGRAELEGNEEEFLVTAIHLDGGTVLTDAAFERELFKRIISVIYNEKSKIGRHAVLEWSDAVERRKEIA